MRIWLQAMYLIAGSKKGISSNQLHRILGVTLKTAWFMSHRIREAMRSNDLTPFGSEGGAVEVDETFIGQDPDAPPAGKKANYNQMMKVLSLVDRDTGRVRSMVVDKLTSADIGSILAENISREARLMTDEARFYTSIGKCYAEHGVVRHAREEYARGDITTNTVEGCFSIFKRGMKGVYQHCQKKNLHRYLAEYDFRYTNRSAVGVEDTERADILLRGVVGKRLTYETTARI
jgi:transposase-like protein